MSAYNYVQYVNIQYASEKKEIERVRKRRRERERERIRRGGRELGEAVSNHNY